jgi:hypothetical protein
VQGTRFAPTARKRSRSPEAQHVDSEADAVRTSQSHELQMRVLTGRPHASQVNVQRFAGQKNVQPACCPRRHRECALIDQAPAQRKVEKLRIGRSPTCRDGRGQLNGETSIFASIGSYRAARPLGLKAVPTDLAAECLQSKHSEDGSHDAAADGFQRGFVTTGAADIEARHEITFLPAPG